MSTVEMMTRGGGGGGGGGRLQQCSSAETAICFRTWLSYSRSRAVEYNATMKQRVMWCNRLDDGVLCVYEGEGRRPFAFRL
jgi:hypothetical protein